MDISLMSKKVEKYLILECWICVHNFLCTHVVSHAAERNSISHLSEMLVLKVEVKLVFFFYAITNQI